jgi:23S rRNA (cytidine1920-2'-O)/16S rRNA (cytidine1409-2'-O)-methyltransferase
LAAALSHFHVDVAGQTCLDVGASTGGFTDCLLQQGASRVYALDVGYGQIAWKLRQDPRVVVIERCNIRHATAEQVPELCGVIVFDVSFISLRLVIAPALQFAAPNAQIVALVKPQFEVGRDAVGKGGIVRDEEARDAALAQIKQEFTALGLIDLAAIDSPILGAKGNHEFLIVGRYARAENSENS